MKSPPRCRRCSADAVQPHRSRRRCRATAQRSPSPTRTRIVTIGVTKYNHEPTIGNTNASEELSPHRRCRDLVPSSPQRSAELRADPEVLQPLGDASAATSNFHRQRQPRRRDGADVLGGGRACPRRRAATDHSGRRANWPLPRRWEALEATTTRLGEDLPPAIRFGPPSGSPCRSGLRADSTYLLSHLRLHATCMAAARRANPRSSRDRPRPRARKDCPRRPGPRRG